MLHFVQTHPLRNSGPKAEIFSCVCDYMGHTFAFCSPHLKRFAKRKGTDCVEQEPLPEPCEEASIPHRVGQGAPFPSVLLLAVVRNELPGNWRKSLR